MKERPRDLLDERNEQIERLRRLGFDVDGGGINLLDGWWDIFVNAERYICLSSVKEVDNFIADHDMVVRDRALQEISE